MNTKISDNAQFVLSGFESIDKKIGGLKKGALALVGGRPCTGKTAFALNVACKSGFEGGHNVLIVSLELLKKEVFFRLMMAYNGKPFKKLEPEGNQLFNEHISIWDPSAPSIEEICVAVREFNDHLKEKKQKLDLIVIDYLQLIRISQKKNISQETTHILSILKKMATDLEVAVLLLGAKSRIQTFKPFNPLNGTKKEILADFHNVSPDCLPMFDFIGILDGQISTLESEEVKIEFWFTDKSFVWNKTILNFNRKYLIFKEVDMEKRYSITKEAKESVQI